MPEPDGRPYIELEPMSGWVRVLWGAHEIASTGAALVLREGSRKPVIYVPRADARMDLMERSTHRTHCPHKGDANYFSLADQAGQRSENAVWSYETPIASVAAIAGHLALYPDRVVIIVEPPAEDVAPEPPE